jgi:hypothetical protein
MRPSLVLILLFVTTVSFGQLSRKEKKAARKNTAVDQPTTLDPADSEPDYSTKNSKHTKAKTKKGTGPSHNSLKEYDDRMDARAKTYRKNEKNVSTEQYVNPMYFGHKKPPKKRPAHKMKLCKTCGIRH